MSIYHQIFAATKQEAVDLMNTALDQSATAQIGHVFDMSAHKEAMALIVSKVPAEMTEEVPGKQFRLIVSGFVAGSPTQSLNVNVTADWV